MEPIDKFRLQTERHQRQPECKAVILKYDNRTVVVFGSIPKEKKPNDEFWDFVIFAILSYNFDAQVSGLLNLYIFLNTC